MWRHEVTEEFDHPNITRLDSFEELTKIFIDHVQPEECGCGHFALYRFIFYDDQHFAAVFRHIVQEELYFSIHIGYTKVAICSVGIKNK